MFFKPNQMFCLNLKSFFFQNTCFNGAARFIKSLFANILYNPIQAGHGKTLVLVRPYHMLSHSLSKQLHFHLVSSITDSFPEETQSMPDCFLRRWALHSSWLWKWGYCLGVGFWTRACRTSDTEPAAGTSGGPRLSEGRGEKNKKGTSCCSRKTSA